MKCKICGSPSEKMFEGRILNKHEIQYYKCESCGFIQTEEPYWLSESYVDVIAEIDIGPLNRAITAAPIVENIILGSLDGNAKYVDWGGGYGLFTRLMRDLGYDFYWRDPHCDNLFAKQFLADPGESYELLTAFEVFEHLPDPLAEIENMLTFSRNLFFTTLLVPPDVTPKWWYLAPETGQHIGFYTPQALAIIAERFGLRISSDGVGNHLLSEKQISPRSFRKMVANGRLARLTRRLMRRKLRKGSLLEQDFEKVSGLKL